MWWRPLNGIAPKPVSGEVGLPPSSPSGGSGAANARKDFIPKFCPPVGGNSYTEQQLLDKTDTVVSDNNDGLVRERIALIILAASVLLVGVGVGCWFRPAVGVTMVGVCLGVFGAKLAS